MPTVADIYQALGRAVLLPVPLGKKGPQENSWQQCTYAQTQDAAYQAALARGNVGVVLGAASDGLCAIDIDDDASVEPFLQANPGLKDTLISKGERGVQIWVRCKVDPMLEKRGQKSWPKLYPIDFTDRTVKTMRYDHAKGTEVERVLPAHWGEWRGDGGQSIVAGRHPCGKDYTWLSQGPVVEVFFREIRWPENVTKKWQEDVWQELENRYGPPWTYADNGTLSQSEHFWAGRFVWEHEVLYEADEERFYQYNAATGAWEKRLDEELRKQLSFDILALARSPAMVDRDPKGKVRGKMVGNTFRSNAKLGNIVALIKGEVATRKIFDATTGVVHLKNGMLDLRQSPPRLMPFSPRFYSRNPIPVGYRDGAQCPVFLKDLLGTALPPDDIELMQRWAGMLLLGRNTAQKIMILTGTAGGGKSTVIKVFQSLIGLENVAQLRTEMLLERFEMFAYVGKTALFGADVPGHFLMQRGAYVLKRLTGGDVSQAEVKGGKDFIMIRGDYNVGITCNSRLKLNLDADADAWRRRVVIIPYEAPRPKHPRDDFADWLVASEGPGILNWMIAGALKMLAGDRLKLSRAQQDRVDSLLEESDSLRSYLSRCLCAASGHALTTEEITDKYVTFCEAQGWDADSQRTIEKQLPDLMLELFRARRSNSIKDADGKGAKGYRGVRLLSDEEYQNGVPTDPEPEPVDEEAPDAGDEPAD